MCRWPSEVESALLSIAADLARQNAEQRIERNRREAIARVEEEMRQQNQPADPVATLPGLVRGRRPLQSPANADGR